MKHVVLKTRRKVFYPKILIILTICFLLLNTLIINTPMLSQTTLADTEHWTNWIIDEDTTVTGETIIVHGDVIVESGYSLTLDNCVLKIDSKVAGNNGIEVESGGGLYVYDTTITSNGELQYYTFEVYGKLMIDNADISKMFWAGLAVRETKDVVIKNSNVHDNGPAAYGITFYNSSGTITGNNVYNNYLGITCGDSNVSITENNVKSNTLGGIECRYNSTITITENNVKLNKIMGIGCYDNSTVSVIGNVLSENRERGIQIADDAIIYFANNTVTSNGNLGIICRGNSVVNINNNVISNHLTGIDVGDNSIVDLVENTITNIENMGVTCGNSAMVNIINNIIANNERRGVNIQGGSAVWIINNTIHSNYDGVLCFEDSVVRIIDNSVINNNDDGIGIQDNATVSIINNIIISNDNTGVKCSDSPIVNITNNTISNKYRDIISKLNQDGKLTIRDNQIYGENGIVVSQPSFPEIYNNIISARRLGIFTAFGAAPIISNCTITNSDEYAIYVGDISKPYIYNCTISNSGGYDIFASNSSHPTLINTIFDFDKLFFNDTESIISIGHWLDINVENKNNVPVQNARVAVMNNNGTEVFNGTSDYNGHCLASVVEYDLDYTFTKKFCTPHTVYASKLGKSDSEKITVDMHRVVNFTLDVSDKLAHGNLTTQMVEGHEVCVEYSGNGTVTIEPASRPAEPTNATKDIGIFIDISTEGEVEDLYITIRYSEDELEEGVNEAGLRMYCYFSPGEFSPGEFDPDEYSSPGEFSPGEFKGGWAMIKNSGVDIHSNTVWASVSHASVFAPMAGETSERSGSGASAIQVWYSSIIAVLVALLIVIPVMMKRKKK